MESVVEPSGVCFGARKSDKTGKGIDRAGGKSYVFIGFADLNEELFAGAFKRAVNDFKYTADIVPVLFCGREQNSTEIGIGVGVFVKSASFVQTNRGIKSAKQT